MSTNPTLITRVSLAAQVRRALADRILTGQIEPGARINESHLAEELGVSRTPLREALAGLERDGFLVNEPGRGYFVSGLTADEANELYSILGILEAAAVRMSRALPESQLNALAALNASLADVGDDPDDAIAAFFAPGRARVLKSGELHEAITAALRDDNPIAPRGSRRTIG